MDKIKNISLANALVIAGIIFNAGMSFAMIHRQGDDISEIKSQLKELVNENTATQLKVAELSALITVH